ncbi:type IX secretion system motor protein PorL/GldL [Ferruginibacter albus]|uniref:type IX secretion system motor protein PorL/GldL n=1 Tax=Ferruginibacter albus TaxID=2875540 RepID=UPI001CC69939|nr:gliding motility protein GldL [Ferruginibacter albus]UAY51704.1 gliding motility protein GldL [Ferruginibacter albus]
MAAAIPPKVSKIFDVGVSIAAAAVIFGALQKILHTPIADLWLKIGLYTEAVIFLGYGVLYLIFPAIDDQEVHLPGGAKLGAEANPALGSLDKMLQEADITPTNLKKLGEGFNKLGGTVNNMTEIGDVVKSTGDFSAKTKEATTAIGSMATAFTNSAATMASFNNASESARGFHEQVQVLTKNLGSLNTIYELELKESNNHLKSLNNFYGKLAEASESLTGSVEDAKKAKEQIGALATNLSKLNSVYGNMLTAMQGRQ